MHYKAPALQTTWVFFFTNSYVNVKLILLIISILQLKVIKYVARVVKGGIIVI